MRDALSAKQTRREFCAQACQAVSLVTLGSILQSCGGSPTSPSSAPALPTASGSIVNTSLVVNIDANSALSTVGSAAIVHVSAGDYLVTRTAQDTFRAFTAMCTHEGCPVTGFQNQTFVCPCHGSEYNTSGRVVKGPAVNSLREFATTFAGNVLTIAIAT